MKKEENTKDIVIESIKPNAYYHIRFKELHIKGNRCTLITDEEVSITTISENVTIAEMPTNITVGIALVILYEGIDEIFKK